MTKYRLYVPDNVADKVARSWSGGREGSIADYRCEKDVRPMVLPEDAELHYLYPLSSDECTSLPALKSIAQSITHLGWGIDMVVADASIVDGSSIVSLLGERWEPVTHPSADRYRVPAAGTLSALVKKHESFLRRLIGDEFAPVPSLTQFDIQGYQCSSAPVPQFAVVFELLNDDNTWFAYPQDRLVHIAGMVRHLALKMMRAAPPAGVGDAATWLDKYVAGHVSGESEAQGRFSYLPLPSIGHSHVDPDVRRVIVTAPSSGRRLLEHLATYLSGQYLIPTGETKLARPPLLNRISADSVTRRYLRPANCWASVTPVILPGHDDRNPEKTRRLIEKALHQAGIAQPCDYEWSPYSSFPKSLPAHKYDRRKTRIGYIRPDHLLHQTAVHLKLHFENGVKVSGPLAIGSGRFCGLGTMAGFET